MTVTRLRAEMPASEFRDWIAVDRYEEQLRAKEPKAEAPAPAPDEDEL